MIREASEEDAQAIANIYNHYIRNTVVTFEESDTSSTEIFTRITKVKQAGFSWLVAEENDKIIGYAYSSPWNERSAYRHTAEVSVYLANSGTSRGWGTRLYQALFDDLRAKSITTVIGGIALPNNASVALHEKFGMEKVAHFTKVGYKFGEWLDVGYWQAQIDEESVV